MTNWDSDYFAEYRARNAARGYGSTPEYYHERPGGVTVVGVVLGQGEGSDTTEILAAAGQAAEQLVDAAHNAITTSRSTHE